jgi:hypothetical protein
VAATALRGNAGYGFFPRVDIPPALHRSHDSPKVVFYNIKKQPVTVTISLAGFALAYDKIKG